MPVTTVSVEKGDLTRTRADAIVNAANPGMLGGGGVDGAIHYAAGPELLLACRAVREVSRGVRCPTGEARITPAFRLAAKWVIHAVGPVYREKPEDAAALASAYRAAFALAVENGARTVAAPAVSCGAYGYPIDAAARIAIRTARSEDWDLEEIRFVLSSAEILAVWRKVLETAP